MYKIEVFREGVYWDSNGVEVTGFISIDQVERMKELLAHLGVAEIDRLSEVLQPTRSDCVNLQDMTTPALLVLQST